MKNYLTKNIISVIIFLRLERVIYMKNNTNNSQIEKQIISYFNYVNELRDKINQINHKIKLENEKLKQDTDIEKEYLDMLVSDCTGKGKYHDILFLPYEIKNAINNAKNKEDKDKLQEKYEIALKTAVKAEQRFNYLGSTRLKRDNRMKESRKNIKRCNLELKKYNNEKNKYLLKIKKLDKNLNYADDLNQDKDIKTLTYQNQEEQSK